MNIRACFAAAVWLMAAAAVFAQDPPAPTPTPTPAPAEPPATPSPAPETGGGAVNPTFFNPAIAVIGNFLGIAGHNPVDDQPSLQVKESEISFQAVVDPYARADVFVAISNDGVELEEGYVTFLHLPFDLLVKVGKFKAQFGKINTLHTHVLPWADEPLPLANLLGSEEGWNDAGVSVARLIELPGDTFSELTGQVFRGDVEGLFAAPSRGKLAWLRPVPRVPRPRRRPQPRGRGELRGGFQRRHGRRDDVAPERPSRLPLEAAAEPSPSLLHPPRRVFPQPPPSRRGRPRSPPATTSPGITSSPGGGSPGRVTSGPATPRTPPGTIAAKP